MRRYPRTSPGREADWLVDAYGIEKAIRLVDAAQTQKKSRATTSEQHHQSAVLWALKRKLALTEEERLNTLTPDERAKEEAKKLALAVLGMKYMLDGYKIPYTLNSEGNAVIDKFNYKVQG